MEYLSLGISAFGLFLSFIAIGFTFYTYRKHDSEIKEQTKLINKYQLDKIKSDQENSKKAIIEAFCIIENKSESIIKIYNKGESIARNVFIEIPDVDRIIVTDNPSPIDIHPQKSIELDLLLHEGYPEKLTMKFKWEDEFKPDNQSSSTIQL